MESIIANELGQDASQLAAAEKRDLLARLLGRLAHEIRNPLSSLDIHLQLLEEDLVNQAPQMRELTNSRFEVIHGELHRLKSIVSQFLRLAGPSALELEPVDVPRVVHHVCELLRAEAATRNIQITTELGSCVSVIHADAVKLTQALVNLVINAMQAVERDGRVTVRGAVSDHSLCLEVRDSGAGIPAEKLPSIFDPYYTTKSEGHGLGLWIVQQIVTAHRGTIRAQNAPEGGAVFTVMLPVGKE